MEAGTRNRIAPMDKVFRKFKSFEEAEEADRQYYLSLTPKERLEILGEIIWRANGETFPRLERVYRIIKRPRR